MNTHVVVDRAAFSGEAKDYCICNMLYMHMLYFMLYAFFHHSAELATRVVYSVVYSILPLINSAALVEPRRLCSILHNTSLSIVGPSGGSMITYIKYLREAFKARARVEVAKWTNSFSNLLSKCGAECKCV